MRLCIVSREYAPFTGGGIGTFATQYAQAFADAGHEVHVLTGPHAELSTRGPRLQPTVHFHPVTLPTLDAFSCEPQRYVLGVYQTLQQLHRQTPFDFIEFPDFWGEGAFAITAQKLLGEFAGAVTAVRLHTPSREVRALNQVAWLDAAQACIDTMEDEALRRCDVVLSPTHSLLEVVRKRIDYHQPTAVIPYPYVPSRPATSVRPPPLPRARILFYGRLERRKGVELLVPALVQLNEGGVDCELHFIGADTDTGPLGGSMQAHLRSQLPAALHDRVTFFPARARDELIDAIREATVCCFPSRWENFPNVCLEAMSQGAVVVGSDAGGMAEIIEDGKSGLLFRSEDVGSLVKALRKALTDEALRARISPAAIVRIETLCEPAAVVRHVEEVVARVSKKPQRKARKASKAPEVSVLVPLYNLGSTLPETLQSLRAQTFDSLEVIVVDDGSTDPATRALLDGGQLDAPGLTVLRQEHRGVSAARNRALASAKGKWVLPVDPDDLLAPNFIETMVTALAADSRLSYATSFCSFFEEKPELPTGGWLPWGLQRDVLPVMNVASSCTALTVRAHLEATGGWDESLPAYEDWDVFCSLAEQNRLGAVIPQFLFFYRVRPDSLMRTVVEQRHYLLLSRLQEKHPALSTDPSRTTRLLVSQQGLLDNAPTGLSEAEPLRYRLVDEMNALMKQVPLLQPALKKAAALTSPGGLKATAALIRKKLQRG